MSSRQTKYEALVQAYAADLFRYAVWLSRHRDKAEDLVQETFMRAWKSLDSLKDYGAAKSWLITILRREYARQFERPNLETETLDNVDLDRIAGFDDGQKNVEISVLRRALTGLAEEYREPLLLQILGGYSSDEIAEMMGISPGAVMTRVFRARQQLRKTLEGDTGQQSVTKVNR